MGHTLPTWANDVLDTLGVRFPQIDEDDYHEMSRALREFADGFDDRGAEVHHAMSRMLSSSEGWTVQALDRHWEQLRTGPFAKSPALVRQIAEACDHVGELLHDLKRRTEDELSWMADQLDADHRDPDAAQDRTATRAAEEDRAGRRRSSMPASRGEMRQILETLFATTETTVLERTRSLLDPVRSEYAALDEDPLLADGPGSAAPSAAPGGGSTGVAAALGEGAATARQSGQVRMELAGAEGGTPRATRIDHASFEEGARSIARHGSELTSGPGLGPARIALQRARGRGAFTRGVDELLGGAFEGSERSLGRLGRHLDQTLPARTRAISRIHLGQDQQAGSVLKRVGSRPEGAGALDLSLRRPKRRGRRSTEEPPARPVRPQPSWHGRSAGALRSHAREALEVGHLPPDRQRALMLGEAHALADEARDRDSGRAVGGTPRSGSAGALLHEGSLANHSVTTRGPSGPSRALHPVLRALADRVRAELLEEGRTPGLGHGRCPEVVLLSERLHALQEAGRAVGTPEEARGALDGAQSHTVRVGDVRGGPRHGDPKPPCATCARILPYLGVTAL